MAKFGKKNEIKIDPLEYNVGLIGESGVGKTTIIMEVLEELAGSEGYMILNIGAEDGVDALDGVSYEDIVDFETLEEFVDDVIENKETDYPNLKVVVCDTMDELFKIVEPWVIKLHKKEHPDKPTKSIKGAFGGFGGGEDKAVDEIIRVLWKLKREAGISLWFTGHTKRRTISDVGTGEEYDTLTSNMLMKYFNAIKTKLHFLGVASIDRDIVKNKVKQKVGNDKIVGKVKSESRSITFRDDNLNIDSKSRFRNVVEKIEFTPEEFIKALKDAIIKSKKNKSTDRKEVVKVEKEEVKEVVKKELPKKEVDENKIDEDVNEMLLSKIKTYCISDDADGDVISKITDLFAETGLKTNSTDKIPTKVYREAVKLFE